MRLLTEVPEDAVVFLRAGMDVPLRDGKITDTMRIEQTRPTIDELREKRCRIIVATHVGRPSGVDPSLSTKPIASYLTRHYTVHPIPDVSGEAVRAAVAASQPGDLIMLENLRFDPREEQNDDAFARELVECADVVVQDAYSNCHRDHASMTGVLKYRPGYAGVLLQSELDMMARLETPAKPYVAIIGGAKADKLPTIKGLLDKADAILLGGSLANTFLKAAGFSVGESVVADEALDAARALLQTEKVVIPFDAVVAERFEEASPHQVQAVQDIASGVLLDIGPQTAQEYANVLLQANTVVWAGPIGVFEWEAFSGGTKAIAQAVAQATARGAFTMAAGGDSAAAIVSLGYRDAVTHVSTGGGVTLQLLEGKRLVAVTALEENQAAEFDT